jgi:hypothetical protein
MTRAMARFDHAWLDRVPPAAPTLLLDLFVQVKQRRNRHLHPPMRAVHSRNVAGLDPSPDRSMAHAQQPRRETPGDRMSELAFQRRPTRASSSPMSRRAGQSLPTFCWEQIAAAV